ncbi:MAG: hypothetical protein P4L73_19020 [Caulobacteraceae bacterium]|nr:hypothetical protein [Caulobacteraceae bacterium]
MSVIQQGASPLGYGLVRVLGYGLSVAGVVLPLLPAGRHGEAIAWAALVVPALVFAILLVSPPAFAMRDRRGRRSVNILLLLPVMGLAMAALGSRALDQHYALLPAALCAAIAVLLGIGAAAQPLPGSQLGAVIFLVLFGAGYGYGGMVFADVRFDHSAGQPFQTQVRNRYVSRGRSTSYHLVLAPWGPLAQPLDAGVPAKTYAALQDGDLACVTLHPGALRMAWYQVAACNPG